MVACDLYRSILYVEVACIVWVIIIICVCRHRGKCIYVLCNSKKKRYEVHFAWCTISSHQTIIYGHHWRWCAVVCLKFRPREISFDGRAKAMCCIYTLFDFVLMQLWPTRRPPVVSAATLDHRCFANSEKLP